MEHEDLDYVVHELQTMLQECNSAQHINDRQLRDYLITRLEGAVSVIEQIVALFDPSDTARVLLLQLRQQLLQFQHQFSRSDSNCTVIAVASEEPCRIYHGNRGRPRYYINLELVELMRDGGFTWEEVAEMVGVSRSTLWRHLQQSNISTSRYTNISDFDLDALIGEIQESHPNSGQVLVQGHLESVGIHVQRYRVRASIQRINPLRRFCRWQQVISRRTYCVKQPNSLWHIDGHHSLIRWRFVVHGGIDGYSRLIVYLHCSTNNKAITVLTAFQSAVTQFGVPLRVRSDKGGENILVCHFMVSYRGTDRGSHIAGCSTHNQRIERLWRDVYRCVCSTYHEMFYAMEADGVLNPDDDDLFVLHCVFLPRINKSSRIC